ncbi:universal stress protein [Streptomyces clavuligerus]|uniref:universal stress protein n=1 Tax=Streptomyces clavuligerus TaxID=1901 RepID=UPI00280A7510|nr:universal stress protein [Streptomyces clavuligerus]
MVGVAKGADEPLEFAFEAAARHDCPLRAVHVWRSPGYFGFGLVAGDSLTGDHAQREAAALTEALRPWRERYRTVEVVEDSAPGRPVDLLTDAAQGASLLVVGHRSRHFPLGARAGSVTYGVLHHVPVPVAVVPHR